MAPDGAVPLVEEHTAVVHRTRRTVVQVTVIWVAMVVILATSIMVQAVTFAGAHRDDRRTIAAQQAELNQAAAAIISVCDEVKRLGGQCPRIVIEAPKRP